MKVVNIGTHTVRHMWKAYVEKLLKENPTWWKKARKQGHIRHAVIYRSSGTRIIEVINYKLFKKIIEMSFENAKSRIIQGDAFNLPHCGKIYIKRIQRDFRAKTRSVDWGKTMRKNTDFEENGKRIFRKIYYFNDDDYLRVGWTKSQIKNQGVYEFLPTSLNGSGSGTGFKTMLTKANRDNKLLKYQYLFCPLQDLVLKQTV